MMSSGKERAAGSFEGKRIFKGNTFTGHSLPYLTHLLVTLKTKKNTTRSTLVCKYSALRIIATRACRVHRSRA